MADDDGDGVFRSMGRLFKSGVVSRDFERVRLLLLLMLLWPSRSKFRCVVSEKANELTDSSPELVSSILECFISCCNNFITPVYKNFISIKMATK